MSRASGTHLSSLFRRPCQTYPTVLRQAQLLRQVRLTITPSIAPDKALFWRVVCPSKRPTPSSVRATFFKTEKAILGLNTVKVCSQTLHTSSSALIYTLAIRKRYIPLCRAARCCASRSACSSWLDITIFAACTNVFGYADPTIAVKGSGGVAFQDGSW